MSSSGSYDRRPFLGPRAGLAIALLVLLAPGAAARRPQAESGKKVRLSSVSVRPSFHRLAPGVAGALPKKASRAKAFGETYLFLDLNGDKLLEPGKDGMGLPDVPFVVSMPAALLLPTGQYELSFGKKELVLTPMELGVDGELIEEAALLTELRIRAARSPVVIDREASVYAGWHLDYLEYNGLTMQHITMDVHREDENARGYTAEGAKAGRLSNIGLGNSFREDAENWFATVYHAVPVLDPTLTRVGVARKYNLSILYPVDARWDGKEILVHPPDGAIDVATEFSPGGEIPTPVPDSNYGRGTGYPIVVTLPSKMREGRLLQFELLDRKGRSVGGYLSSPSDPANEALPANAGSAFFIPRSPLAPKTRYTVRFHIEGLEDRLEWSFTTREVEER